ncbi:MAG: TVP38/TMEM64 family protein [Chthoniobacterales bacterium]|nr:TVP38/TMEM64 family protein [Chthoniobacterales bacterium]
MEKLARYWKWIAALVVIAALFVASRVLPVADWLRGFSDWAGELGPLGIVLFIVVYALATVLFVPGWPLTVAAGFTFGLFIGTAAVSAGSVLGASAAFLIARFLAREQVESRTKKNEKFRAIDGAIGEQGWKLILLLRLSPIIPFNLSNYFYGVTAVPFWPYVFASWIGMLPGTVLYVYLGTVGKAGVDAAAGAGGRSPWEWVALGVGLAATVAVTIWVAKIARRALKRSETPTS